MAEATWNNWRTTLNDQGGGNPQDNNPAPTEVQDDWADLLDDDPQETEDQPQETQANGNVNLTADQLNAILERQNKQFQEQQRETMQFMGQQFNQRQPQAPTEDRPAIEMPDPREMRRAMEEGDYETYFQLAQQEKAAIELQHRAELNQLSAAALQRFEEINGRFIEQQPEYKTYEKDVEAIMDEIKLPAHLRKNPQIVAIAIDAAKGRNIDREVDNRIQERRRQRQQTQTSEPTETRLVRAGAGSTAPTFTNEAYEALRMAGRSPDRHAQALGYENWAAYERATQEKYDKWDEMNVPAWRRRMNSGRNTAA